MSRSPWRTLLYEYLNTVELTGRVLDLGGDKKSLYYKNFRGIHTIKTVNLDSMPDNDFVADLEQSFLSVPTATFDHVLAMNLLEHIYNYKNIFQESYRVLKPGGEILFGIPFLIQVHPSPNDYWRYTAQTLELLCHETGYKEVQITSLGSSPFTSAAQLLFPVLRFNILKWIARNVAKGIDALILILPYSRMYTKEYYPLGYIVRAKK